jgi:uncharacterized membrane protein
VVKNNWKFKLGVVLVSLSMIIFIFIFFIPLLNTTDKNKIFIAGVAAVAAEVLFWSGGLLLGKQIFDKYKSYLKWKTWFDNKKKDDTEKPEEKKPDTV